MEEKPGQSTPQATTPMNKTVNSLKHTSQHTNPYEINNNTSSDKNMPKKHQQTVRFISDHKSGKSKLKSSVTLAESEESIISDSSYGISQHVRMMMVTFFQNKVWECASFSCLYCTWLWFGLCLWIINNNTKKHLRYAKAIQQRSVKSCINIRPSDF